MVPLPVFAFHCQSCHYCLSYWRELLSLPSVRTSPALGGPGTCSKAKSMNKEKSNDLFSFIHIQPFHLVTTLGNKKKKKFTKKKICVEKIHIDKNYKTSHLVTSFWYRCTLFAIVPRNSAGAFLASISISSREPLASLRDLSISDKMRFLSSWLLHLPMANWSEYGKHFSVCAYIS